MRILWCHEVSYLDKPVYEYQDFPERLAARGHDVEVIDFSEAGAVVNGDGSRISRTGVGEVTYSPIPHHNLGATKYIEARVQFRRMLLQRLRRGRVDAIFVYSVFINGTQAVRLGKKFGIPVIYRVLDAYHRLRPGLVTQTLLRSGERYIYRNADSVMVTNEKMIGYVMETAVSDVSSRIMVVDHGVDSMHFAPRIADVELMVRHGIAPEDKVALFLGTTYSFSGLLELLRRVPQAVQQIPNFKLLVVGGGEQDADLAETVARLGLTDSVILTGMVPYQQVPRYLSLAHLALNPFEINDITRDIIPIKILQYQAAGLPVLSTPLPDVVLKHPAGTSGLEYSATDQPDAFFSRMLELLQHDEALAAQGRRGLEFVNSHYSVERAVDRIESTLSELHRQANS